MDKPCHCLLEVGLRVKDWPLVRKILDDLIKFNDRYHVHSISGYIQTGGSPKNLRTSAMTTGVAVADTSCKVPRPALIINLPNQPLTCGPGCSSESASLSSAVSRSVISSSFTPSCARFSFTPCYQPGWTCLAY